MKVSISSLKPFMGALLKADESWLVGGAIRDAILGREVKDYDFVIKGSAIEFARHFAAEVGGSFVLLDAENDEGRVVYKPESRKELIFDFSHMDSIESDLSRRDFTINAIACRLPGFEVFDPFSGLVDIKNKQIKMLSKESVCLDPLRILRGFRFRATLGFNIVPATLRAMRLNKKLLTQVSAERIKYELFCLLDAKNSYLTLRHMARYGVLQVIIPELNPLVKVPQGKPGGNLLDHSLLTVKKVEELATGSLSSSRLPVLKLCALLHDIGKPYCYSEDELGRVHFYGHEKKGIELLDVVRDRLRLSNQEFKFLQVLIQLHMRPHLLARERNLTEHAIFRLVRDGGDLTPDILLLAYADALASGGRGRKRLLHLLERGINMWDEIRRPKFKRLITGDDLIAIGLKPGPEFKAILAKVDEAQVSGELKTRAEAIRFVRDLL